MKKIILLMSVIGAVMNMSAVTFDFTYNTFGGIQQKYGNNKAETISVAVFIGPELAGKKVKGLNVPVYAMPEKVENISGWTSTALDIELINSKAFNVVDGVSSGGSIGDDNILRVSFPDPVEVPVSGFYVGYTFQSTTKLSGTSVAVVDGNREGECFYLASRSKKKWTDLYTMGRLASAMIVTMEGDFESNDVELLCENALGLDNNSIEATVVNHGADPVRNLSYTYETDNGISGSATFEFEKEVPAGYGRGMKITLPVSGFSMPGDCRFSIAVTSVNDMELPRKNVKEVPLSVLPFVPEFRPLVEEYTYLGCGWCPRGYVMLEQMKARYRDKFIGISYHSSSNERKAMACIDDAEKPLSQIGGYPAAEVNRSGKTDPSDVSDKWKSLVRGTTTCDVSADFCWSDETKSQLVVRSKARFIKDIQAHNYRMAYILVGDGLSNKSWSQSNYYSDQEAAGIYTEPFWDLFIGQKSHIVGLNFNDIALAMTDFKGIEASLPESLEAGKEYEFSYVFDKDAIRNLDGQEIVTDYDKLRCVVLIVDSRSGRVANSVSTLYPDGGDPFPARDDLNWNPEVDEDLEMNVEAAEVFCTGVVKTEYYGLTGFRIMNPSRGDILIKSETLSDGRVRRSKVVYNFN